jgi:uncharacterized protein with HEPN domain
MVEPKRRDKIIVKKILAEIDEIFKFTEGVTEEDFLKDTMVQKAVVMTLINIGELSKSFSDEFVASKRSVPWKEMQAMRNVAAHRYEAVKMQRVWDTIQNSIAELKRELLLEQKPDQGDDQ